MNIILGGLAADAPDLMDTRGYGMTGKVSAVRGWMFREDLRQLQDAYRASRSNPDSRLHRARQEWAKLEEDVAAGVASFTEEDEDGQVIYDKGDHFGELAAEIGRVQQLVREAFAISLYHFWEREAGRLLGKEYKPKSSPTELEQIGLRPDFAGLERLRLVSNVAKHSAGNSADQLYQTHPEMFDTKRMTEFETGPDYESLILADADIEAFFAVVQKSGPPRPRSFWARQIAGEGVE